MIELNPLLPCKESCLAFYKRYWQPLDNDFHHEGDSPAILDIRDFKGARDYIAKIHFNKRYGYKQALKTEFYVQRFNYQSFIGDIVDINTSKAVRAGGPMRANYLTTVEERGGYLKEWREAPVPECNDHCYQYWGVFMNEPGRKQGDVVVNKRLLAYIGMIIIGQYAMYSMIIGHGDYLKYEIMTLLHIHLFDILYTHTQARYIEYHTYKSGRQSLTDWKSYFLFKPVPCQWKYPIDHTF